LRLTVVWGFEAVLLSSWCLWRLLLVFILFYYYFFIYLRWVVAVVTVPGCVGGGGDGLEMGCRFQQARAVDLIWWFWGGARVPVVVLFRRNSKFWCWFRQARVMDLVVWCGDEMVLRW
jgi:hypothetical protein